MSLAPQYSNLLKVFSMQLYIYKKKILKTNTSFESFDCY